jgi:hypothetical protein
MRSIALSAFLASNFLVREMKNSPPYLLTNNHFPGTLAVTGTDNTPDNDFVTVFKALPPF